MTMDLSPKDLRDIFVDNMKKAADRCMELYRATHHKNWKAVAKMLDNMRMQGADLAKARSLSVDDRDRGLDRHKLRVARQNGEKV